MNKGLFIVIEGIDGSGKSTQASLLHRHLQKAGMKTLLLAEPSEGKWGKEIRRILSGDKIPPVEEQLELFLKDREDDARCNIRPALAREEIIVMDRYFYSNAAYQGAMGLDYNYILRENRNRNFPIPDLVYFVDIPVSLALKRIEERNHSGRRDIFEKEAFLEKVRKIFLSMETEGLVIIDGTAKPERISENLLTHLYDYFQKSGVS